LRKRRFQLFERNFAKDAPHLWHLVALANQMGDKEPHLSR
jgi:hypothetical protein